ncbi:MAG: hypothetical protein JWM34_3462 [Ilumatobacteraceae bacterium]|nr:hypothetical protein [Ilumatobacteraceae bacterium]
MRPRTWTKWATSGRSRAATVPSSPGAAVAHGPRWLVVVGSTVAFGTAFAFLLPPKTALYWYVFPLFGLAVPYLVEVRHELTPRWWLSFAGAAIISPIALKLDWAFSGHILWNVLLLGHIADTSARDTAWAPLFGASLVHLFVLKAATQSGRDLIGGVLSAALAGAVLAVARQRHGSAPSQGSGAPS